MDESDENLNYNELLHCFGKIKDACDLGVIKVPISGTVTMKLTDVLSYNKSIVADTDADVMAWDKFIRNKSNSDCKKLCNAITYEVAGTSRGMNREVSFNFQNFNTNEFFAVDDAMEEEVEKEESEENRRVTFDRVLTITDGAPTQFKNRYRSQSEDP